MRRIDASPASAGEARGFVASTLREWGCAALVETATLLVSELVTNAVLHACFPAQTAVEVRMEIVREAVRVEVADFGNGMPVLREFVPDSLAGRGLSLVDALATTWGVLSRRVGKVVWFELDRLT